MRHNNNKPRQPYQNIPFAIVLIIISISLSSSPIFANQSNSLENKKQEAIAQLNTYSQTTIALVNDMRIPPKQKDAFAATINAQKHTGRKQISQATNEFAVKKTLLQTQKTITFAAIKAYAHIIAGPIKRQKQINRNFLDQLKKAQNHIQQAKNIQELTKLRDNTILELTRIAVIKKLPHKFNKKVQEAKHSFATWPESEKNTAQEAIDRVRLRKKNIQQANTLETLEKAMNSAYQEAVQEIRLITKQHIAWHKINKKKTTKLEQAAKTLDSENYKTLERDLETLLKQAQQKILTTRSPEETNSQTKNILQQIKKIPSTSHSDVKDNKAQNATSPKNNLPNNDQSPTNPPTTTPKSNPKNKQAKAPKSNNPPSDNNITPYTLIATALLATLLALWYIHTRHPTKSKKPGKERQKTE